MFSVPSRIFATGLLIFFGGLIVSYGAGSGRQTLPEHVPALVAKMTPLGRMPVTNLLHLTFSLPLRNQAGLDDLIRQLYDPASPNYRQFITPQEFTARFGPSAADYATLLEFARTNGFEITGTQPNRMLVDVAGTVATAERVFGVTLRTYRHPKEARDFFAPDKEPSVAAPVTLLGVIGLDNYSLPRPKSVVKPLAAVPKVIQQGGSGSGGSYLGNDFRAAYVPGTLLTGSGQSVALLQFDGYYLSDIASYLNTAGYPVSLTNVLTNVAINGGVSTPGSGNGEVCLDIEMVMAMAPGISKIYVYEGPNGGTSWPTILSKIANDNLARQISCSWGSTTAGSPDPTSEAIFKQMSAQGQSFFNASGDSDAFVNGIPFPSESTNITQVGGTTLSTTGPGGAWSSETAWNWGGGTGTSGGVSVNYGIPTWQQGLSMTASHGSTTKRNVPDVALTGDNVYVKYNNGSSGVFGGTSCAAPLWAGFMALVNQQAALAALPPMGFVNPALYAIGKGSSYNTCFHDTASGNNYWTSSPTNFPAVTGFDLCTGWGTPNGTNLINTLAPLVFAPSIAADTWMLQAESAVPTNGAIDPGETVTVSFALQNSGSLATSDLVATLQPNAGVLVPDGPQSYGAVAAFGGSASRTFTFTTAGDCGSNIVAELQLQDGTNDLGTVSFTLPLGEIFGLTEDFDAVTSPSLPADWATANVTGTSLNWVTTTAASDTTPNSAFNSESDSLGENALVSPAIAVTTTGAQLSFRQNYNFEYGTTGHGSSRTTVYYDGGVLEIQIGNGAFTDILSAGGSFVAGGYNHSITTSSDNPLGGRSAWGGSSSGWKTVTVNLPSSAAGQNIRLRWNCGTDSGNGGGSTATGWYVDSVSITDAPVSCLSVFADLAASQSLATDSLQSGQNLVYTLSVTNLGPQSAANVVLTDTVPANVTFVSASPGCGYGTGQVLCPAGTLAVGGSTNFTVTLAPSSGNVFTNVVSVGTVTPEITTANNQAMLISTQAFSAVAPQITLSPVAQTIECGGNANCSITASGTLPLAIQWSLDGAPVSGATNTAFSLANVHQPDHTISVSVTNLYGSVTSNAIVNVLDTLAPVIALNGANPLYVELGGTFTDPGAMANDACAGTVPVTITGTVDANAIGTNILTYTAGDGNGNTNSITRSVIVQDTTVPTIVWSFTNLVLVADTNCSALMPDVTGTNYIQATDLSEPLTITQSPTNGTVLAEGTNLTVLTVVDAQGNPAYSTNAVVVKDETPPVIMLAGANPLYVELGGAFVDPGAVAVDTCAGIVPVTTNGMVNVNVIGTNTLTYMADDGSGNTNSATRTVIVQDTKAPTIVWSFTNLVLAADTNCSALMPDVTGTNCIQATDLSEPLTIAQSPTNGTVLAEGSNSIVLTVVDAYGNTGYSTNMVLVKDETPPVITLNGANPVYVELGGVFTDPGVMVSDTCSTIALLVTNGVVNVNTVGTNVLTYTVADSSSNTNSAPRTVIVQDMTPPAITWSFTNLVLAADTNCSALMPDVTGTNYIQATDLSGPLTIAQSPTNGTVLAEGTNVTELTVVDAYGNTVYSTNVVIVRDETPPVVALNGASPLYAELGCTFTDPGAVAADTCAGIVPVTTNGTVDVNAIGTNTLTYTADDGSGNTNSATRTVIVRDTTPPAIVWSFTNLVLAADTNCSALMPDVTGTNYILATDLSGPLTITQSPTNGTVLAEGTNLAMLTVVDAYGNTAYSTNLVVVKDETPPTITLNGANPLYVELGSVFTDPGAVANDLCSAIALLTTNGVVSTSAVGTNMLAYLVVDSSGNTNSVTRTVIVQDTTAPTIVWSFTNLVLVADTNCGALMPDVTGTNYILATDLSGPLTIVQSPTNGAVLSLGSNEVVLVVLDDFGNAAYSTNFMVVQDQSPPVIVLQPQSQTNYVGSNVVFSVAATACTPVSFQWFFNAKVVADETNGIFAITNLQSANIGDYFAIASSDGGSVTSAVASLTILLTNDVVGSNGGVTLTLAGVPGSTYILETTTNLSPAYWLPFDTNTIGTNGLWQFNDPQSAEFRQRFFRLKLVP